MGQDSADREIFARLTHESSDESESGCGPYWAPKPVNSDYLFLHMDDGWNESRESPLVLPGLPCTLQSSWQPYPDTNAPRKSCRRGTFHYVTYTAPSPVIEYVAPAPAVTFDDPATVIEYVASAPVVFYAVPAPVIECSSLYRIKISQEHEHSYIWKGRKKKSDACDVMDIFSCLNFSKLP